MNYWQLGSSGLLVSELTLGTMIFGEQSERSTPAGEARAMIDHFLDSGGNHLDTANVYAQGRSEEIVGEAIKGRRDRVVLATKVRFSTGEGPNQAGLSRFHVIAAVEASLRRLQTDTIDLLYMHAWDPLTPLDESLRAFDDLVRAGKVRYIGVSNFKAWQLMKALGISRENGWAAFVAAQYQYSLVKRDLEYEFTDLLRSEGVGLIPWGPLGGGFLSGKYHPDQRPQDPSEGRLATMGSETEKAWERRNTEQNWNILEMVSRVAEARGATPSQVAIAWLLHQPAVSSVILGVRTMEQMEDNLASSAIQLSADDLEALDRASALFDLYPYGLIERYASRNETR